MAASGGWPPASWRAWRRCRIAAHGYGIRYDHGMFRQVIQDGWQQEYPENWLTFGNPWEITRPDATHQIGFGGTVETRPTADGGDALRLAPGGNRRRGRLRYAGGRLARALRQHAAAVVGAGGRSAAARCVQSRRPYRRAGSARPRQRHLAGAVSERRDAGRPGTAAAPGIFLHLRVAAGPRRAAHAPAQRRHPHCCPTRPRSS